MTGPYSAWADNEGVRLHFLDSGGPGGPAPILFVPGLSDVADEYAWLLDAWRPRRTLIVDLRGRGRSDAPATGYRPVDHAGDIVAVLAARAIPRVHLVTFSRGTSYALTWALAHPDAV